MDIKLKNKSKNIIAIAMILYMISISLLVIFDLNKHRNVFKDEPYKYSSVLREEINKYIDSTEKVFIIDSKIEDYEIENLKIAHQNLMINQKNIIEEDYNEKITKAEEQEDKEAILKLYGEKFDKLVENKNIHTKSEEELRKEILDDRNDEHKKAKEHIEKQKNIKYFIINTKTKDTYTNIDNIKNINDVKEYINTNSIFSMKIPYKSSDYNYSINNGRKFEEHGLEGYFVVPKKANGYSQIHEDLKYIDSIKDRLVKELVLLIVSFTSAIVMISIIIKKKILKYIEVPEWLEKVINKYKKIPLDIRISILFVYAIIMNVYLSEANFFYFPLNMDHFIKLTFISLSIIYFILNGTCIVRLYKNRDELSQQWSVSLWKRTVNSFKSTKDIFFTKNISKIILKGFIAILIFLALAILSIIFLGINNELFLITFMMITIVYMLYIINYVLRKIAYLNNLVTGIEEISSGNLNYEIEEKGSGTLAKIGYNINHMREGFKKSLETQIKSERLKTELITNVSHDLKTPLTSIINYVNILKKEDSSKEEIEGYVEILDRKSQRLKTLIDDLFEVTKLSSGEVDLKIERVDVVALLRQAMAEFEGKIKKSSLSIKTNTSNQNIYMDLDGNKMWRVFENLISNILKYSQPNTRVYIDIIEEDKKVIITMKNISSHELNFGVDEIFERFKRGDDSRNTEGSGLGLAIAKSIVELQGGKLDITIDGDLFKVNVEFYQKATSYGQ
ncbi:two-component system signal transduction histidine kinase [Gottschalkia acidurici 9a]|uniref:histidine kinase n=1 Tax=Gottschalkia acidurici (strain ATCC 7906 / DSM 604 / BCRC 14475 / CIP 104303 / KCTC 5404 / NCIMB 10678 / 9a) TaxID=1128398 RepID=K0B3Z1_GOTA9|nr:histidine kinase dimerization/phospho-acceptor domain-containing protein [Gottschalkia acidurici]AFS79640.1 two-component system signal transduction histidine kinase [Gottschalkia acidurici 9a]